MLRSVNTEIIINAPPSAVRKVFLDFPAYPQWNRFVNAVWVSDPAAPPGTLFKLWAWKFIVDRSTVVQNDDGTFAWLGGGLGLRKCWPFFSGYHYFKYEPHGEEIVNGETKECRFIQAEEFHGFFVFLSFIYGPILKYGFKEMNRNLKARVESLQEAEAAAAAVDSNPV